MPPKGYRHLSIREEVYKRLEEFAKRKGLSSITDALVVLLDYADIYSKIEYILQRGVNLLQPGVREVPGSHTNTVSKSGGKKTAIEVLKEVKVRCISDMRTARNPEAIIERMKVGGAVVIRTDEDVCAVDPEFWDLFGRELEKIKTADDKEVLSKLKDEKMKKLFQLLRKPGALYLDNNKKKWVFDYDFIEEPGKREDVEEEVPLDWELA